MTNRVDVMGVLLPGNDANTTRVRVRWFLCDESIPDGFVFPLPGDHFEVELKDGATDQLVTPKVGVAPHPMAMIDPPRKRVDLTAGGASQYSYPNLLPDDQPWARVDHTLTKLARLDKGTYALGIAHLLGQSHPAFVETRLRKLVTSALQEEIRELGERFDRPRKGEIKGLSELFALAFRTFPGHPSDLVPQLIRSFREWGETGAADWARSLVDSEVSGDMAETRKFAGLLHLFNNEGLVKAAVQIAGDAADTRNLMAMRAAQGGELLDFWCDYDAPLPSPGDQPPVCDAGDQGRRILAAEAMGLGVDISVATAKLPQELNICVRHVRPAAVLEDDQYHFPENGSLTAYEQSCYSMPPKLIQLAKSNDFSAQAPPSENIISAWIDYDLVSSIAIRPGSGPTEKEKAEIIQNAKPGTGDGMVSIQIVQSASFRRRLDLDYSFNLYAIWDGESSTALQRYIDDPSLNPELHELKPYLVTRRYSFRRDIKGAFLSESRIDELNLLDDPPYEATMGAADTIKQLGEIVPYPSKPEDVRKSVRITFNLRELFPAPEDERPNNYWERPGGGRPYQWTKDNVWTVEKSRPGTGSLSSNSLPQRYRFWVTAVDPFEQESSPIRVYAAEHGTASGDEGYLFAPRWRTSPPPAQDIVLQERDGKLSLEWKVASQTLIGTDISNFRRGPLDASIIILRRVIEKVVGSQLIADVTSTSEIAALDSILDRHVTELRKDGWEVAEKKSLKAIGAGSASDVERWQDIDAETGYEYLAVLVHKVPDDKRRFVHSDEKQVVRYLQEEEDGERKIFQEIPWTLSKTGPDSLFRNHPSCSPIGQSAPHLLLPGVCEFPKLVVEKFGAERLGAKPVMGVIGINRDEVLSKFIQLKDPAYATGEGFSKAEKLIVDTAIDRLRGDLSDPDRIRFRQLLEKDFLERDSEVVSSHPLIGFRGGVRLSWQARREANVVPTVAYRAYGARVPYKPSGQVTKGVLDNGKINITKGPQPNLSSKQASMVVVGDGNSRWTGLAWLHCKDRTSEIRVTGLAPCGFIKDSQAQQPLSSKELELTFQQGAQLASVGASLSADCKKYELSLPIGGGHRELALWWIVAVDCTDKEQWLDDDGAAIMHNEMLAGSITPLPATSLKVRTPVHYVNESVHADDFGKYREYLPTRLPPKEGLAVLPRAVLTWNAEETAGTDEYIFIERQDETRSKKKPKKRKVEWELLKTIQKAPVGSFWKESYKLLTNWLKGGPPPTPPGDFEQDEPEFFFPRNRVQAWELKKLTMLRGMDQRTERGFVDHFDIVPSRSPVSGPILGGTKYRYRAFRLLDLAPELGDPTRGEFHERFLVSEASQWSSWVKPDWPVMTMIHSTKALPKGGGHLARLSFTSFLGNKAGEFGSGDEDQIYYRVSIRRKTESALGSGLLDSPRLDNDSVFVGELVEVPLERGGVGSTAFTWDHTLERDSPLGERDITYYVTSELIWKEKQGFADQEHVLRMADERYVIDEKLIGTFRDDEAALDISVEIMIGQ